MFFSIYIVLIGVLVGFSETPPDCFTNCSCLGLVNLFYVLFLLFFRPIKREQISTSPLYFCMGCLEEKNNEIHFLNIISIFRLKSVRILCRNLIEGFAKKMNFCICVQFRLFCNNSHSSPSTYTNL